jgi:hypothetical protein
VAGPASLISWVIAAIIIGTLAFIHAELATAYPVAGGTARAVGEADSDRNRTAAGRLADRRDPEAVKDMYDNGGMGLILTRWKFNSYAINP